MLPFHVAGRCLFLAMVMMMATLAPADATGSMEYNFVMRFRYPNYSDPNLPNCAVHEQRLNSDIRGVFERNNLHGRELGGNFNCASFCRNVAPGYCYYVSGGICSNRRRNLREVAVAEDKEEDESLGALIAVAEIEGCEMRSSQILSEIFRYGSSLDESDKCKSMFLVEWDVDCFSVSE